MLVHDSHCTNEIYTILQYMSMTYIMLLDTLDLIIVTTFKAKIVCFCTSATKTPWADSCAQETMTTIVTQQECLSVEEVYKSILMTTPLN